MDGCTVGVKKIPLSMHVICNKAKRICKHLIADAGEEDPEKISCSKWKMSCMVLIAANLRHENY